MCVYVKTEHSEARLCKSERERTLCVIICRMAQRRTYVWAGTAMCVCMCEREKATAACALYTAGGEAGRREGKFNAATSRDKVEGRESGRFYRPRGGAY